MEERDEMFSKIEGGRHGKNGQKLSQSTIQKNEKT